MVGQSTILAICLILALPLAGADRFEDDAGDQITGLPDQADLLSVEIRAQGTNLEVTLEMSGDVRAAPGFSYHVNFYQGNSSFLVACNFGGATAETSASNCWTAKQDPFTTVIRDFTVSADGTTWSVTAPLSFFGLSSSDVIDRAEASSRPLIHTPGFVSIMPPYNLDEIIVTEPFRLAGA